MRRQCTRGGKKDNLYHRSLSVWTLDSSDLHTKIHHSLCLYHSLVCMSYNYADGTIVLVHRFTSVLARIIHNIILWLYIRSVEAWPECIQYVAKEEEKKGKPSSPNVKG